MFPRGECTVCRREVAVVAGLAYRHDPPKILRQSKIMSCVGSWIPAIPVPGPSGEVQDALFDMELQSAGTWAIGVRVT